MMDEANSDLPTGEETAPFPESITTSLIDKDWERRRALFVDVAQASAGIAAAASIAYAVAYFVLPSRPWQVAVSFGLLLSVAPVILMARWLAQRGYLGAGAFLFAVYPTLSIGGITLFMPATFPWAAGIFVVLILLMGMILDPRAAYVVAIGGGILYWILNGLIRRQLVTPLDIPEIIRLIVGGLFYLMTFLLVAFLSWLATSGLKQALKESRQRANELQQAGQRQAQMLAELEERTAEQARLLALVEELSTPVIPIFEDTIALPLVGSIDSRRAQRITANLLEGISQHRAKIAIIDITGVPTVDTAVVNSLMRAVRATELMGCQVVLTGIRPEIAHTLVVLGVDLGEVVTLRNLQSGIEYAAARQQLPFARAQSQGARG
ncbi:MAG: STAS domain-containing protein [Anaerolineae bacterium]|nr:STAS domain-containing protein [Anaerolineae bacterium]